MAPERSGSATVGCVGADAFNSERVFCGLEAPQVGMDTLAAPWETLQPKLASEEVRGPQRATWTTRGMAYDDDHQEPFGITRL